MPLYPEIEPFDTGRLKVSAIHELYYEQSGNKDGNPVVVLHGGPGGSSNSKTKQLFDPKVYRVIAFDQRGAGKSTPPAELKENTTWDLVADIETLRKHLGIKNWVVYGGSWGSALGLAYSETHPDHVKALIIRGIYTIRRWENVWVNQEGVDAVFPDHWEDYVKVIPECERGDLLSAYHRRMTGEDQEEKVRCVKAWNKWEDVLSQVEISDEELEANTKEDYNTQLQHALIECQYFLYGGWLRSDSQLLDDVDKIRHIPGIIIQGRYDMCCPMKTAWQLHKAWPEAEFHIVARAGHTAREPGIEAELLKATEKFKHL